MVGAAAAMVWLIRGTLFIGPAEIDHTYVRILLRIFSVAALLCAFLELHAAIEGRPFFDLLTRTGSRPRTTFSSSELREVRFQLFLRLGAVDHGFPAAGDEHSGNETSPSSDSHGMPERSRLSFLRGTHVPGSIPGEARAPSPAHLDRVPRRDEVLRVRGTQDRRAGGDSRHQVRLLHDRRGGAQGRRGNRRPGRDQVAGAERRPDEGRRGQVRRHARRGRRARRGDPQARDQRAHAARRAGRSESRDQAGVLRGGRLGRHREETADAVQRHGRDRHRGGRRDPPRPRRPRPRLQPAADRRLRGQAGRSPRPASPARSSTARRRSSPSSPASSATTT